MRDPERIDRVLDAVQKAWHANPDLRLTQLLFNVARATTDIAPSFYVTEDEVLVAALEDYYRD